MRHQAHDRCGDEHVQDSGGGGAVQGRLAYVDPRVLDPTGHDASGLNTDEREQRHTCGENERRGHRLLQPRSVQRRHAADPQSLVEEHESGQGFVRPESALLAEASDGAGGKV